MKITKPICFFDLETTGTDVVKDRIVEISVTKVISKDEIITKTMLLNPEMSIPVEASQVHGISDEKVKDSPTFKQISKSLLQFMSGCDLGGFNSDRFDIPMLIEEFGRVDIKFPEAGTNSVDVLKIERKINPNTLSDVYKRYTGKELDNAHSANADVLATIEILTMQEPTKNMTASEIEDFCKDEGKERVCFSDQIYKDKDGVVKWAFGKHINKPIDIDYSYVNFVLSNNFPTVLKNYLISFFEKK